MSAKKRANAGHSGAARRSVAPVLALACAVLLLTGLLSTWLPPAAGVGSASDALRISEVMTDNRFALTLPDGSMPDWIEIENTSGDAVQLAVLVAGFGGLFAWVFGGRCGGEAVPREAVRLLSGEFGWREAAVSVLTVGGAYFLGPDIASRSLLARDGRTARRAVLGAAPALAAFAVGITLAGMWAAANAPGAGNPVLRIAVRLPAALRWGLEAGLLAALLSSADTCLVNAGAIAAYDLAGREGTGAARTAVAAVGAAATGLALAGGDIIGILLKAYSVYVPGVVCPLAVAIVAGRVRRTRTWLAGVAAGGACGLAGACGAGGDWLPVAGMGIWLGLGLAAVGRGRE